MVVFIFLNQSALKSAFYAEHFRRVCREGDFVVCVDGGYALACNLGVKPLFVIGDLDSLPGESIEQGVEVISYPEEKDFSDFELALRRVEKMEPERVYVYGALGGRKDHEITNILLMAYTPLSMVFVEEDVEVYNVSKTILLEGKRGLLCSLLALGGPCRVKKMEGFKYVLKNEVLLPSSRGLSNIITQNRAVIEVTEGRIIFFLNLL
jgi:thiamine pyrophosphokinase